MAERIAVITGASGGFGREFTRLLSADREIDGIWAIARNQAKLDQLKADFGEKIKTFSIDLSDTKAILGFKEVLDKEKPEISYLINNAGFAKLCAYSDISVLESVNMIDLNCGGVVAMGLVCIPYMSAGSRMLNVASQSAFQPLPYLNIYGATKAFVRNYSRALNIELKERGITVTAVCPGWMDTDLIDRARVGAKKAPRKFAGMVTPGKVAKKALSDAKRGRDISVYGAYVKFCHTLAKVLPQRLMMKIWLIQQGL